MQVVESGLPDVLILEPKVYGDQRGFFFESYNQRVLRDIAGIDPVFVQDNHSRSAKNVLRGLHYQIKQAQGKLIRAISGCVLDVAVDIRRSSPTFGKWVSVELSAENKRTVWIPKGFAHGFAVLSQYAEIVYKTTDYWAPGYERTIAWDDPDLAIDWRIDSPPVLSAKDSSGRRLRDAEVFD
jgi:dTDP-4-dehydrorhamnose 3,5-epimerase